MKDQAKRIFGIDLGTTYSSIAYVDEYGKAVIIPNAENERVTPSVVFFDDDSIVIGDVAKESSKLYPNEVVSFVKRSMGEPNFIFLHNSEEYRAEEISAYVLKKLAQDADQLSFVLELKKLEDTGAASPERWLPLVIGRIQTQTGRQMAQSIMETQWDEGWTNDYSE